MQGYAHIYQHNLAHYKQSKQEGSARIMANVSLTSIMLHTRMARFRAGLTPGQSPTVCTHQLQPTHRMRRVSEKKNMVSVTDTNILFRCINTYSYTKKHGICIVTKVHNV